MQKTTAIPEQGVVETGTVLENEYEHIAVPVGARKSLWSVSSVWIGFPMILTSALTGSQVVAGLGFIQGMLAIVIGNLIMFGYVGLLGILSAKRGYNFALQASTTFGKKGYMLGSGLLSTLVVGWFAVQTGMTGTFMNAAFGTNLLWATLIAGLIYMIVTFIGIRGLSIIGAISAPLFFIFGLWTISSVISQSGWGTIVAYKGSTSAPITFGLALTLIIALFADAGTMGADYNRWAKSSGHALFATSLAFPFAQFVAMFFGGVITAAAVNTDVFRFLAAKGGFWAVIAVLFLFINLGSVCSHVLYNAAVGWSHIIGGKMRITTIVLGVIGIVVAMLGIYSYFISWLTVLGILVPPIGAIILVDQFIIRKNTVIGENFRSKPFIAWAIGSAVALFINFQMPYLSTAIAGLIVAGIVYWLISISDKEKAVS